uniref:Chemokine interleukin-8-like domain-containing protein n=1 Tax=Dicentrarchus labrax TaxID=13489 RepID=A0A8C4EWK4_DICLA
MLLCFLLCILLNESCFLGCFPAHAVNDITPAKCCFQFFNGRIPQKQIKSTTKTHSKCVEKAFVVSTAKGTQVCVRQNLNWAQEAFKRQHAVQY